MTESTTPRWTEPYDARALTATYETMAAEVEAVTPRFDRGIRCRLFVVDGGWVSLTELDDDFHSMRVGLRIDADGVIVEAGGAMLRRPYDTCPRALESLRGLVGASVARPSAHKQIKDRVPRTEGCLHVVDMLTVAFRAFRLSKGHDIEPDYAGEETRRMLLETIPTMRNTCLSFAVTD
ncbi:MAG TPA: DUF2889 domain-containing protein [Actinomycetota bacterium]|nr:DUF2889 domain-containing protein [Actinomycetota bacterium]